MIGPPHPEYHRLETRIASGVAHASLLPLLRAIVEAQTLYTYAAGVAGRRELAGRGPAYAIPLGAARVVVRHVRHGGLLAPITSDVFLTPTRAPYELAVSHRLRESGVPTPEVLAYVTYRVAPCLRRADVVTREIPDAIDLGAALAAPTATAPDRSALWELVTELLEALAGAGAYHADLNVTNVLVASDAAGRRTAYAIDVDRVVWGRPGDAALVRTNLDRLRRSARKRGVL